jgi:hypothetical protein
MSCKDAGSHSGEPVITYNDEVTGSSPVTPTRPPLRAKNLSDGTVASYLAGVRQFPAFLQPRGRELEEATRADLEAFIADLLSRCSPATASTRYEQPQWLALNAGR